MADRVTYPDVEDAARQLLSEGKSPTVNAVINLLGSGSATTVTKHLQTFRKNWAKDIENPDLADLPTWLARNTSHIWEQAKEEALDRLNMERKEAEEAIKKAKAEAQYYEHEYNRLRTELDTAGEHIEALRAANEDSKMVKVRLEEGLRSRDKDIEHAKERLSQERSARQSAQENHKSEMAELKRFYEKRIEEISQNNEARLHDERQRWEAQERHWLGQLETVRQEANQTIELHKAEREKLERQVAQTQETLIHERQEAQSNQAQISRQLDEARQLAYESEKNARKERTESKRIEQSLRKELKESQDRVAALKEENVRLNDTAATNKRQIATLEEKLAELEVNSRNGQYRTLRL